MNEIVAAAEPCELAGLAAHSPALFLFDESARKRFFGFFTANIRIGIRGARTTRRPAGFLVRRARPG